MRVALGKIACSGIEAHLGEDIPAGVRRALFHYACKLEAGHRPVAPPRFLAKQTSQETDVWVELMLDLETEAMLEREALSQQTTMDRLAAHIVLVYLAELDLLSAPPRSSGAADTYV